MLSLLAFASRRHIMGDLAIQRPTMLLAFVAALLILALNAVLLLQTCGVSLPFLSS
jgi:manganese transport protein